MDLLKHGESAYPADAWVEQQYMKEDAFTAVSIAWQVLDRHSLVASLLTYCLRPSSLQLFWDHLYSTEGTTTSVSKNAVLLGYHHSQYGFHLCGVFLSMHNYPPFRRRYFLVFFRISCVIAKIIWSCFLDLFWSQILLLPL